MRRFLPRFAVALFLVAAFMNGVAGPVVHGHLLAGSSVAAEAQEQVTPIAAQLAGGDEVEHADCEGDHDRAHAPQDSGGHSHGQAPDGFVCNGAVTCCGAVVVTALPDISLEPPTIVPAALPRVLHGMTPPVGDRPPPALHV